MHRIAVSEGGAALVGDIADGVVSVRAVLLSLVGPECAAAVDQPVQIVVRERPVSGEQTIGDRGDVAVDVEETENKSILMPDMLV
jgi:hypothetical protein